MMSYRAWWHLKSPASWLFTQAFIQAQIIEKLNIKAPRHWPLWGEFTGDQWIPHTKSQQRRTFFIWWRHHEWWKPRTTEAKHAEEKYNPHRSSSLHIRILKFALNFAHIAIHIVSHFSTIYFKWSITILLIHVHLNPELAWCGTACFWYQIDELEQGRCNCCYQWSYVFLASTHWPRVKIVVKQVYCCHKNQDYGVSTEEGLSAWRTPTAWCEGNP